MQKAADMRLHFLLYILQRRSLWDNIYNKMDPFEFGIDNNTLLVPIVSIISNWLPPEHETDLYERQRFEVWNRWVRFPVEISILVAFEVLQFVCQGQHRPLPAAIASGDYER